MILGCSITTPLTWTDQLNLNCYVLYQTKTLTIAKMHITLINIFMFIVDIATVIIVVVITIIIITITTTVITYSIVSYSLNLNGGYVKSDKFFLQFLCHMTFDVKFSGLFFIYLFFVQKLQNSIN